MSLQLVKLRTQMQALIRMDKVVIEDITIWQQHMKTWLDETNTSVIKFFSKL